MSFKINRVYTRSGDQGETGLVGGERVSKADARVAAYGEVDELNAALGCVKEKLTDTSEELRPQINELQQQLFDLGSELATPSGVTYPGMWQVSKTNIERLEKLCDSYGQDLEELTSFILPGGSELAAELHRARTVCRRCERSVVELQAALGSAEPLVELNANILRYLNRLSDLLFVLARWSLHVEGKTPPLWVQAKDRV